MALLRSTPLECKSKRTVFKNDILCRMKFTIVDEILYTLLAFMIHECRTMLKVFCSLSMLH